MKTHEISPRELDRKIFEKLFKIPVTMAIIVHLSSVPGMGATLEELQIEVPAKYGFKKSVINRKRMEFAQKLGLATMEDATKGKTVVKKSDRLTYTLTPAGAKAAAITSELLIFLMKLEPGNNKV